jgi:FkbM family methyltransferase
LRDPIGFHLAISGSYERTAVDFVLKQLAPGMTFVDVGANIGVFTIPAARRVGPLGTVVAIEASPSIFSYLVRNVGLNDLGNVQLIQCAVLDRNGPNVPFYEAPVSHFGMGALAAQFGTRPIAVPARTLDDILADEGIRCVGVLKVDVEGYEAAVFRGAQRLLVGSTDPLVVFEFCDWAEARVSGGQVGDAQRVLCDAGYRIWRLRDFIKRKRPKPLEKVITKGYEMLVAVRGSDDTR